MCLIDIVHITDTTPRGQARVVACGVYNSPDHFPGECIQTLALWLHVMLLFLRRSVQGNWRDRLDWAKLVVLEITPTVDGSV